MNSGNRRQDGARGKDSPSRHFGQRQNRSARYDQEEILEAEPERFPKREWRPGTMLAPVPAVLVSCGNAKGYGNNIITLGWTGTVCSEPPMVSVSIRPSRYSHEIISSTREFVLNVTTGRMARAVDWCGVVSGRDEDKFAKMRLTPLESAHISAPGIAEAPVNMECKVTRIIPLGSHDLFLAEIVGVHVSEELLDKAGKLRLEHADLLAYAHGEYYVLGKKLGYFGYSVKRR